MRYAAVVEYAGTAYRGFQTQRDPAQSHIPTIQAALETALSKVANTPTAIVAAGRTDAGVHAVGQVIHFDNTNRTALELWRGANHYLPADIKVQWVGEVPHDFHARFHATARTYQYVVLQRTAPSALLNNRALWHPKPLDIGALQSAATYLKGAHDFTSFRAAGCQAKHARRTIHNIAWRCEGERYILEVRADGFLYHMVRNIVGHFLPIGQGRYPPAWMGEVLEARQRTRYIATAPAHGLYFVRAEYGDIAIPAPRNTLV